MPKIQPDALFLEMEAEIKRLTDYVEGLESDLENAVEVAYKRGAVDWAKRNYPKHRVFKTPDVT